MTIFEISDKKDLLDFSNKIAETEGKEILIKLSDECQWHVNYFYIKQKQLTIEGINKNDKKVIFKIPINDFKEVSLHSVKENSKIVFKNLCIVPIFSDNNSVDSEENEFESANSTYTDIFDKIESDLEEDVILYDVGNMLNLLGKFKVSFIDCDFDNAVDKIVNVFRAKHDSMITFTNCQFFTFGFISKFVMHVKNNAVIKLQNCSYIYNVIFHREQNAKIEIT